MYSFLILTYATSPISMDLLSRVIVVKSSVLDHAQIRQKRLNRVYFVWKKTWIRLNRYFSSSNTAMKTSSNDPHSILLFPLLSCDFSRAYYINILGKSTATWTARRRLFHGAIFRTAPPCRAVIPLRRHAVLVNGAFDCEIFFLAFSKYTLRRLDRR